MPYVTAVFDRTATDIATRTSKAFFNIADWDRIEDNAIEVRAQLIANYGIMIVFTGTASAPAITSIPDVDDFNRLLENIEQLRQAAESVLPVLSSVSGFSAVTHDWVAGPWEDSPDYTDVNHWEEVMDIINEAISFYFDFHLRFPRCGIASCGAELIRQNMFRS